ncbi:hypothetical protein PtB15_14B37 [Puccinia triticina]|nr:hypothetical protein PtB15_14B37 [Puccinia triticina]
MNQTPRNPKRTRQKSPSRSIAVDRRSNNGPPPLDDQDSDWIVVINENTSLTQPETPSTSQPNTSGPRELTDMEELGRKSHHV